jgi:hypothetical protein
MIIHVKVPLKKNFITHKPGKAFKSAFLSEYAFKTLCITYYNMKGKQLLMSVKRSAVVVSSAAVIGLCSGAACSPMHEGIRGPANPAQLSKQSAVEVGEIEIVRPPETRRADDPYAMNERMRQLASSLTGDHSSMVSQLHGALHSGAEGGVRVDASQGRAPRTASETLAQGGDCTDLAGVVITILESRSIPGGALVVHFNGDAQDLFHMVPFASVGGSDTIIDLQSPTLGATASGSYTVVHRLTYEQARYMYHAEMGDYQREQGNRSGAIAAYRRAVAIYNDDAYVHHNLGVLLEQEGNMAEARTHLQRAAQLNPSRYQAAQARGSYNDELRMGYEAYEQQRWADCVRHFRNALASGESISADERSVIEQSIGTCERNSTIITSE